MLLFIMLFLCHIFILKSGKSESLISVPHKTFYYKCKSPSTVLWNAYYQVYFCSSEHHDIWKEWFRIKFPLLGSIDKLFCVWLETLNLMSVISFFLSISNGTSFNYQPLTIFCQKSWNLNKIYFYIVEWYFENHVLWKYHKGIYILFIWSLQFFTILK